MLGFIASHWRIIVLVIAVDLAFGQALVPVGGTGFKPTPGTAIAGAPRRLVLVTDGFIARAFERFWNARGAFGSADVVYVRPKGFRYGLAKQVEAITRKIEELAPDYDEIVLDLISMGAISGLEATRRLGGNPRVASKVTGVVLIDSAADGGSVRKPGNLLRFPLPRPGWISNILFCWVPLALFVGIKRKYNPHQKVSMRTPFSMLVSQGRSVATARRWWPEIHMKLNVVFVRSEQHLDEVLDGDYSIGALKERLASTSRTGEMPVLTVPGVPHASIDTAKRWEAVIARANHFAFTGKLVD